MLKLRGGYGESLSTVGLYVIISRGEAMKMVR